MRADPPLYIPIVSRGSPPIQQIFSWTVHRCLYVITWIKLETKILNILLHSSLVINEIFDCRSFSGFFMCHPVTIACQLEVKLRNRSELAFLESRKINLEKWVEKKSFRSGRVCFSKKFNRLCKMSVWRNTVEKYFN